MKIILTSVVRGLGSIGDIITVKDGYAKNFLIPSKLAIHYSEKSLEKFKSMKKTFESENSDVLSYAENLKLSILSKSVIITENASDDGRLYGSVTASIIADRISSEFAKNKPLTRNCIELSKPIKETGIHLVKVRPHPEVEFDVKVVVSRTESEAEAMLSKANY